MPNLCVVALATSVETQNFYSSLNPPTIVQPRYAGSLDGTHYVFPMLAPQTTLTPTNVSYNGQSTSSYKVSYMSNLGPPGQNPTVSVRMFNSEDSESELKPASIFSLEYTVPTSNFESRATQITIKNFTPSFNLRWTSTSASSVSAFKTYYSTDVTLLSVLVAGKVVYEEQFTGMFSFDKCFGTPDNAPVSLVLSYIMPASHTLTLNPTNTDIKLYVGPYFYARATERIGTPYPNSVYGMGCIRYTIANTPTDLVPYPEDGGGGGEDPDPTPGGDNSAVLEAIDNLNVKIDDVNSVLDEHTQIMDSIKQEQEKTSSAIENQTEEVKKGFAGILDAIVNLPKLFLDGLVSLFVPSAEDITSVLDKFSDLLSEMGFIGGFFAAGMDLCSTVLGYFSGSSTYAAIGELQPQLASGVFHFPGVSFPMNGETITIIEEQDVQMSNKYVDLLRPVLSIIVTIICILAFINSCWRLAECVFLSRNMYNYMSSGSTDLAVRDGD